MNKLSALLIPFLLLLSACGVTQQLEPVNTRAKPALIDSASLAAFIYAPEGREEFVFDEVAETIQKYAYKDICFSIPEKSTLECFGHQLTYDEYVGKRGFYTGNLPIKKGHHVLKEAILETGELIYAVTSTKFPQIGKLRLPLDIYLKRKNFVSYPIVEGAAAMVTGYSINQRQNLTVSSNKLSSFTTDEIKAIQRIASQHPKNGAEIADLMTILHITYDDFDGRTIISSYPHSNKGSYLSLRIVIKEDGVIIPFVVAHYESKNWLFVEGYSVKADEFKWRSDDLKFKREHTSGTIWEWNNSEVTSERIKMLNELANANVATVRFHGKYYDDHSVTQGQQKELKSLLKILELSK